MLPIWTLDFESYWDRQYSLSKLSPLEYVMGDKFQLISCSVKLNDYPTDVLFGEKEIRRAFAKIDWSKAGMCAHNMSGFDAYIVAYYLGIRPRMWFCTAAMARPIHGKTTGVSLAKLVEHYADELVAMGIKPRKNNAILMSTQGKRLEDFTAAELKDMEVYNKDDTDQCRGLFKILSRHHRPAELWQIDTITRMRTEPQFELDTPMLETAASIERDRKLKSLLDLAKMLHIGSHAPDDMANFHVDDGGVNWHDPEGVAEVVRSELASAPKFSALLEKLGVEVPMKPSPTNPDKEVPALSKTDEAFVALQEHPNDLVAAAARARLDVKSTLLETRIGKFLTAGSLAGGRLPIPIRYCGADTTGRDSGEEYNPQNMPRINPDKPKITDCLRKSLRAPKGKVVIVADQSGIELRVNHFLWKAPSSMALYQASPDKADLYRSFAADNLYHVEPDEITKPQRQIGKLAQLGLGFGSGAQTFRRIAKTMGGVDLPLESGDPDVIDCVTVVNTWREAYAEIVQGWAACGRALFDIRAGLENAIDPWGLTHTCAEGIVLPSGRIIRYPDLRLEDGGTWPDGRPKKQWMYAHGRHKAFLTGPKVDENIVQALARDSVFDCSVDYFKSTGLRPALRVHDELVYVVDEAPAADLLAELQRIMRTPPKWWPELVVWSEGDMAGTYGDAK